MYRSVATDPVAVRTRRRMRGGLSLRARLTAGFSVIFTISSVTLVGGLYFFARSIPIHGEIVPPGAVQLTPEPRAAADPADEASGQDDGTSFSDPIVEQRPAGSADEGEESGSADAGADASEDGRDAMGTSGLEDPIVCELPKNGGMCTSGGIAMEWEVSEDPLTLGMPFLIAASVGLAVLIALSTWGSWLLAGRILRPIHRVREAAEAAARGSFDHRLSFASPAHSSDEVARLAATFDHMLERIDRFVRDQRRVAAHASHELRGPLAATKTLLEAVAPEDLSASEGELLLRRLKESNQRNIQLVESILEMAELALADLPQNRCSLRDAVVEAVEQQAPAIAGLGLEVRTDLVDASAIGDELLLEQVVHNLVGNAVIHNVPGGAIEISLRRREVEGVVRLRVQNTGRIIAEDEVARLTDISYRNAAKGADSHGIGLAFVKSVVEAHNGTLALGPRMGGGLVCVVTLPDPTALASR